MDEVLKHEPYKPGLAAEPIEAGYSLEKSGNAFSSGLYFDENLEKGFGINDTSSIFYYGLNGDGGGLDCSASGEGKNDCRYGSLDKMLPQDAPVDPFAAGCSNPSKDYCWDIDFSKKVPDLDYQFCEESGSGSSVLVSQSSRTSNEAVAVSESSSQILECHNDQLEMLITCENYMNSFVLEMLMNNATGLTSSSSCDLQDMSEVNNVASSVETSESYRCRNDGCFVGFDDINLLGVSCTSISMQRSDSNLVEKDTEADNPSLQAALINKPANSSDIRDIDEGNNVASPLDTGSYHQMNEGYVDTYRDLDPPVVSFTSMSTQSSEASPVDEDTEADNPFLQGVLLNKPADCCDLRNIGEGKTDVCPSDTSKSHNHMSEGYLGTTHDLNPQGLSCTSIFMQCADASPMVQDTEDDNPSFQGTLVNKPVVCKKFGTSLRQRARKPNQRCTSDSPDFKSKRLRRRKEDSTSFSKQKHLEAKSQNKRHQKRIKDAALVAHDTLARRSIRQDLDSDDEEYDPFHSNLKVRRSKKGSDRRKNNKLWTLSEVVKLVDGISQFGVGKWTAIQRNLFGSSPYRTSLDLRDKWRNLLRTSVRLQYAKEEDSNPKNGSTTLPKFLLDRIRELDSVHPYPRSDAKLAGSSSRDLAQSP